MKEGKCEFLGVRTEERASSALCRACKAEQKKRYDSCTAETHEFERTSITVEDGKTVAVTGPLTAFGGIARERGEAIVKAVMEKGKKGSTKKVKNTTPEKRLPRVPGVIQLCVSLLDAGKTREEVGTELSTKYAEAGYPEKKAQERVHSIVLGQLRLRKKAEDS